MKQTDTYKTHTRTARRFTSVHPLPYRAVIVDVELKYGVYLKSQLFKFIPSSS